MATPTYIKLAEVTASSGNTLIEFSSLPTTYRDLVLVGNYFNSSGGVVSARWNGATTSQRRIRMFARDGNSPYTDQAADANIGEYAAGDLRNQIVVHWMDYRATDKYKVAIVRHAGLNRAFMYANHWESTSAVTSVGLTFNRGLVAGSTFALYGIE